MAYFDLLKNVTRRTRFLLVFLMSLIGLSASAGTYYADLNVAVNPADLDEGDMVVMCHVNSKAFVGYDGSKELTTTHVKTSDQTEAKAFVYTVTKDGYKVALKNGNGYGPQIANRLWGVNFTYSWSTSPSSFTVESTGGTTRLYVTGGGLLAICRVLTRVPVIRDRRNPAATGDSTKCMNLISPHWCFPSLVQKSTLPTQVLTLLSPAR